MPEKHENPCHACAVNRECCTLKGACGLMLTNAEYERHFRRHEADLTIRQTNGFYIISSREGRVCPHLDNNGCRIYRDRPIDCRLYPYIIRRFIRRGNRVKVAFHSKSGCPEKKMLIHSMSAATAKSLAVDFGKEVFGDGTKVVAQMERGLISRLCLRLEAAIARLSHGKR